MTMPNEKSCPPLKDGTVYIKFSGRNKYSAETCLEKIGCSVKVLPYQGKNQFAGVCISCVANRNCTLVTIATHPRYTQRHVYNRVYGC